MSLGEAVDRGGEVRVGEMLEPAVPATLDLSYAGP